MPNLRSQPPTQGLGWAPASVFLASSLGASGVAGQEHTLRTMTLVSGLCLETVFIKEHTGHPQKTEQGPTSFTGQVGHVG